MTKLKKSDFISAVAERAGLSKADATRVYDAVEAYIHESVAAGCTVPVPGIGKVVAVSKGERNVRNPRTGETSVKAAYRAPRVTIGKQLKDAVA